VRRGRAAVGAPRPHQAPADHRLLRGGRHAGQRAAGVDRAGRRRRGAPHLLSGGGRSSRAHVRRWGACRGWRRSSCGRAACVLAWTSLPSFRGADGL
jgi:hypothetical protein